jgi:aryl-alcohol dehydrogenase-like predicted oxidoreductase
MIERLGRYSDREPRNKSSSEFMQSFEETVMLPKSPFGRTGHQSTRVIFGAAGLGSASQSTADRILDLALSSGINHIDTAASYGASELRIGPWLTSHRSEFFLASKLEERDAAGARASLERSLERLQVDQIDLIQMHNLVEEDEWTEVHNSQGALSAMIQAREEGLVRFLGVTGHGTRIAKMHLRSLSCFDYDSVLLPFNHAMLSNDEYRHDTEELLELCAERNVAVQTIKAIARGRWSNTSTGANEPHFSWYEPLSNEDALTRAVHYVLAKSQLFLNTSSDYRHLPTIIKAAQEGSIIQPSESDMANDIEEFGITPLFDGHTLERI